MNRPLATPRPLHLVLVPLLAIIAFAPAHAADPAAIVAAKRALQRAVNAGSGPALVAARAQFAGLSAAEPDNALLHYYVAYAAWRTVPVLMEKQADQARDIGDDGLAHLDRAIAQDPKFVEAIALKGGLQGIMISLKPGSMMTLGPQSGANGAQALGMAPDNPRARLLNAIGVLHKPAAFGGGADKALPLFEQAQAAFATATVADSTAPDWGADDAWLWMGRAHDARKEWADAVKCYQQVLTVNPQNGWTKTVLLPRAEKSLAGDSGRKAAKS